MYLHHKVFWALVTWDLAALGRRVGALGLTPSKDPWGFTWLCPVSQLKWRVMSRGMAFLCQNSELLS